MNFGYREVCLDHDTGPRHPESPDRLRAIRRALKENHGVEYVAADDADLDLVRAVHDTDYIAEFREFCDDGGGNWDADTVAVEETWDAALASAGLAVWAAEAALDGNTGRDTPFSLGRPPGHHAVGDDAMGFCFINNAAVAAQAALEADADRVAIFDWDVHHGNGTQDIFYDRSDVFYASIHEDGLYPGTGDISETGTGDADGTNLNVKYKPGADTADYLAAIDECIAPAIRDYDPDLLLISAGFDAHEHDPISRMRVSTEGYGAMTDRMRSLTDACDAALGIILEGGYGLDTLSDSVTTVHEVFDGYQPMEPDDDVSDDARDVLDDLADQGFGSK
ncbi:acetoin utilization deacetylase AcuC-like enzyme [Haloarcula quadrata]|jgi:acetoin utilization deacetylase AcuC-like enzyme|uniref:Acetoin utilization deacetylase AcuC-like enzyme n=2 Tax=Haloarcula TaxID=2237 RepID=A0A495R2J1_9EURY|nr:MULTISPECIES: histone deacetylase [Haloarcula]EMA16588.1 acetoin utilization protein [Haloarcula californiae ATCC 33799]NHN63357.1 histone deacetylase [Haloarcula sp. JP-Z28]NHX40140.1 histone deacetylase [Haloarcula sp. R1-2]RKS81551.1 acetoin utilization deacetylase AcuC-like enzyme [Haloarcula quadrata]